MSTPTLSSGPFRDRLYGVPIYDKDENQVDYRTMPATDVDQAEQLVQDELDDEGDGHHAGWADLIERDVVDD